MPFEWLCGGRIGCVCAVRSHRLHADNTKKGTRALVAIATRKKPHHSTKQTINQLTADMTRIFVCVLLPTVLFALALEF